MWPMGSQLSQEVVLSGQTRHLHVNELLFNTFFFFLIDTGSDSVPMLSSNSQ